MSRWKTHILLLTLLLGTIPQIVLAQSSSTNYSVDEFFIGPGGGIDLNSANYNARASLGDTGVGNYGSANYQAYGGFTTTNDPFIELAVTTTSADLGVLDTAAVQTATAGFSIRTYLASGYSAHVYGGTLTNQDGYEIPALAAQTASIPGTEQFGLNLVANAAPAVGANPVQVPDAGFSFGQVNSNYGTANQFRFVSGDEIAYSNSSSGQTDYTMSYMANIQPVTGAGTYQAFHSVVVTSTY